MVLSCFLLLIQNIFLTDFLKTTKFLEKNQEKIALIGGIPILIQILVSKDDPILKLACTATIWNLSVNGTH
jgi:hypothetical protein